MSVLRNVKFWIQGLGTDDKTLIRVIITRAEVDMVQVKQEFQKEFGKSLEDFIKVSIYACNKNNIENDIVWMTLWVWKSLNVNFLQCLEIIWCDRMAKTRYFKIVYDVILTSIQNCKKELRKDIHKYTPPQWYGIILKVGFLCSNWR